MTESTEIAHFDEQTRAVAHRSESANVIAMVLEAARDPSIDAVKVQTMAELAMTLQDREIKSQFNRDINAAMAEMPIITKAGVITIVKAGEAPRVQGRFARLEDIDRVIKPIARRHHIGYRWDVGDSGSGPIVRIILTHDNGYESISDGMKMPLDTSGGKNNVQGVGSSTKYGMRYTLCTAFNIQTEGTDDDGSLGKYDIGMPHEREVTVLEQAEEAEADGRYADWFTKQSVKDRAWLVSFGHHARLGGVAPQLDDRSRSSSAPTAESRGQAGGRETPEQWVSGYEARCAAAVDLDALQEIQKKGQGAIDKLKSTFKPELYDRAIAAGSAAYARLSGDGE